MQRTNYELLIEKLDEFIRKYYKNLLIRGALYFIGIFLGFYLTVILLEYFGNFNTTVRTLLFYSFLLVNGTVFVRQICIPALKLYRLIWMRFIASQMTPAVFDQTTIDVNAPGKDSKTYLFRATGSVPKFDGFLKVYEEGKDQKDEEDEELKHKLPAVTEGEVLKFKAIEPEQHLGDAAITRWQG